MCLICGSTGAHTAFTKFMVPAKATSVPAQQVPNACASPLDKFATSYVTTVAQTERSSKEQHAFLQTFSALSTLVASNNKCACRLVLSYHSWKEMLELLLSPCVAAGGNLLLAWRCAEILG